MMNRFLPENPLFRLLLINGLIGTAVAVLLVAGLMITDAHRIGTLILNAENPVLPIAVLTIGLVITFGSVAMGMAIMSLPYDDDSDGQGGHRSKSKSGILASVINIEPRPAPVPVRAGPHRPGSAR